MKTKILILIAASAVVTFSFAFTTKKTLSAKELTPKVYSKNSKEPSGGFVVEDKM